MDGIPDPEEDINNDGKFTILDCLPEEMIRQLQVRLARTAIRVSEATEANTDVTKEVDAVCPDGYMVIGGGIEIDAPTTDDWDFTVEDSYPATDQAWRARANARFVGAELGTVIDAVEWSLVSWAICDRLPEE